MFGKSASAGVINITTQPPTDEFTARLDAMATDDGEHRYSGTVSGPISRQPEVPPRRQRQRLSRQHSQPIDRQLVERPAGHDAARQARLDAGRRWTVTLSPYYTETDASCCAGAEYFVDARAPRRVAPLPVRRAFQCRCSSPASRPGRTIVCSRMDVDAQAMPRTTVPGLKIARQLGDYTLASITSYDRYQLVDRQDTDSTDIDFSVYQPISPPGGSANGGFFEINSTTQEFRLTSPEQRLRYVAGAFFSDTRSERYFVRGSNTLDDYNDSATPSPTPSSLPTTNSTAYSRYLSTRARHQLCAVRTGQLRAHRSSGPAASACASIARRSSTPSSISATA